LPCNNRRVANTDAQTEGRKYSVEMGSVAMIYTQSVMKTGLGIRKWLEDVVHTGRRSHKLIFGKYTKKLGDLIRKPNRARSMVTVCLDPR
jgi:hypothetical protein